MSSELIVSNSEVQTDSFNNFFLTPSSDEITEVIKNEKDITLVQVRKYVSKFEEVIETNIDRTYFEKDNNGEGNSGDCENCNCQQSNMSDGCKQLIKELFGDLEPGELQPDQNGDDTGEDDGWGETGNDPSDSDGKECPGSGEGKSGSSDENREILEVNSERINVSHKKRFDI